MGHLGSRRVAQALIAACVGYFHSASGASYQYLGPRLPTDPVRGPCAARAAPLRARSVWTSGKASALLGAIADFFAAPAREHNRADASRVRRRRQPRRVQAPWHVAPHQNQQNPTSRTRLPRTPRLRVVAVGSPLPPPLPPRPLLRSSRSRRLLQTLSPPQVPAILALSSPSPRPSRSLQRIRRVVVAGSSPPRRPLRRSRPLSSTWPVTRSASPMSQRMLS